MELGQIVDMGFPRDQVIAALKAAFNNSERAVEYLMTGIPESRRGGLDEDAPAPAPAPAVLPAAAPPQTAVPVPPGPNAQPLDMFASQVLLDAECLFSFFSTLFFFFMFFFLEQPCCATC